MSTNESYYVGIERDEEAKKIAEGIMATGVKGMDALHVACAILAGSDYLITTDDRLLKYQTEKIQVVTPGEFIRRMEAQKFCTKFVPNAGTNTEIGEELCEVGLLLNPRKIRI